MPHRMPRKQKTLRNCKTSSTTFAQRIWKRMMGMKVTRATTTAALAAFSLLATPCLAATEPAPPSMVVTRINGRSVDPLIAFAEAGGTQSMFVDAVIVTALNIHGAAVSPPPPKYDK